MYFCTFFPLFFAKICVKIYFDDHKKTESKVAQKMDLLIFGSPVLSGQKIHESNQRKSFTNLNY